ncbi:calcineurin-dependent [Metarhizium acridum CQMa 102]|uniref:Calcineurin-dependent n=1 Tax=Metarhizium acridum (strain CQMa 102) TaxID=655827 RepID=E9E3I9_METAQ|nr:calcineurin-dependent [Metarhizium acridum CQMa 102]EFY89582.1 calcineurin-dependent [Metarhizium acridum CQMa 102]
MIEPNMSGTRTNVGQPLLSVVNFLIMLSGAAAVDDGYWALLNHNSNLKRKTQATEVTRFLELTIPREAMSSLGSLSARGLPATPVWWNMVHLLIWTVAGFTAYWFCLVLHRLFLHPLRNVPGPKVAAATSWYEFYQDVILDGHYLKEYPRLHAQYGPIVRVSPNRVHINDSAFYHKVYSTRTKYLKEPALFKFAGELDALPFIMEPAAHKIRRAIVGPMFSPRSIQEFSPAALQIIKAALGKVEEAHDSGLPVSLKTLESNFAMDIIMKLCFGRDMNCTKGTKETTALVNCMITLTRSFCLIKHFPILGTTMQSFPNPILARILPGFVEFRQQCAQWVAEVRERHQNGVYRDESGRQTVFDAILEAEPQRTTKGCGRGIFPCYWGPEVQKKLLDELDKVETNNDGLMEYQNLVNLPYLTAIIQETLRISSPAPGILTRLVPAGGTTYSKYFLPAGTSVSTAQRMIHYDPDLFPEPDAFMPERWLGDNAQVYKANLIPFGKGPRMCVGMYLSYMEAYVFLGNLFRRFDMSLHNTDQSTLRWKDHIALHLEDDVMIKVNSRR